MSQSSLPAIAEESSHDFMPMDDENDFDGSDDVLELDNEELLATPLKSKPECKTPQAPKKASKPSEPKADEIYSDTDANQEEEKSDVEVPTKFDVLCGQSRICANHTGNRRFQVVLDIYATRYDAARSKQEKMTLTKEIVGCIGTSGGRFLKYKDGVWTEISSVMARDKVSHALRTKVQSRKKQEEAEQANASKKKDKEGSIRKSRRPSRRRSAPSSSSSPSVSEVRAVSFDGSDGSNASSNAIMDELLRSQREIFEQLAREDMQQEKAHKPAHPLKRTETWS